MKTWEEIVDEFGLVPPEQSMREQEELIAAMGEEDFCKEYLRTARKKDPAYLEECTWVDIMNRRIQMRLNRQEQLGLYVTGCANFVPKNDPEEDPQKFYVLVQYRDGETAWCPANQFEDEIEMGLHLRTMRGLEVASSSLVIRSIDLLA